jgi:FdrA protein
VDEHPIPQSAIRNPQTLLPPVALSTISNPLSAINVGLESFTESLTAQGAPVVQVDWRPPAGGNERLMGILGRMKKA